MRFFNYHAPETVRIFTVPMRGVRRRDAGAVVYDVRIGAGRILRHYSFGQRWFEVNCTLDLAGSFVTEPGPIDWTFNCDICTPHFLIGADVYNMDLWLDVLVAPDGRQHMVIDEADFTEAVRLGQLTEAERQGALTGLSDLLGILQSEGLVNFLDRIYPFANAADCDHQPPMERRSVTEFPMLLPLERQRLYGRHL